MYHYSGHTCIIYTNYSILFNYNRYRYRNNPIMFAIIVDASTAFMWFPGTEHWLYDQKSVVLEL